MKAKACAVLGVAVLLACPVAGIAQTGVQERLSALEKRVESQGRGVAGALGLDIHALVAVDYVFNTNNPDVSEGPENRLRLFDDENNSFTLNQANLRFSRERENEDFGFVASIDFGKTAEVLNQATWWKRSGPGTGDNFELREAFVTYKAPIGDGVTIKAGKMVTLHGAEVVKEYNNLNPTISNSFLFAYAIPFTHTGAMASFPLGDYLAFDLGVVNGWDDVADKNDGKSFHGAIKLLPEEPLSLTISGTVGPEQMNSGRSKRALIAALVKVEASDELTFLLDGAYGTENDVPSEMYADGYRDVSWYGAAGYVIYKVDERLSLSFRGEVFDDADGSRTGVQAPDRRPGVTLWEMTPSVAYKLTDGLTGRFEFRHDEADRKTFWTDVAPKAANGQNTLAVELVYAL